MELERLDYPSDAVLAAIKITAKDKRIPILHRLAPKLTALSIKGLYQLWTTIAYQAANRVREQFLADLVALAPVIWALGGEAAVVETYIATNDVGEWWP